MVECDGHHSSPSASAPTALRCVLTRFSKGETHAMAGDRLTALDASFLHLEDAAAHMHVASVMVFEGDPPPYDELLESHRAPAAPGAALPPAAGLRAARPGPPAVGRRPAPQPALPRARHRAPLPRRRGPAAGPGRPRVRPAAGPRQAAVGDLAGRGPGGRPLRAAGQDPPRAGGRRLGRGHHVACCSTPHPSPPRRPTRAGAGSRARCRPSAQLLGEALLERATVPGEVGAHRARRVPRRRGRSPAGW